MMQADVEYLKNPPDGGNRHFGSPYSREQMIAAGLEIERLRAQNVGANEGWQPIETAPRDHFPRLVWSREYGQCVAFLDVTWAWWPVPATKALPSPPQFWRPLPDTPKCGAVCGANPLPVDNLEAPQALT